MIRMSWTTYFTRIPYKIVIIWIVLVVLGYYFTIPSLPATIQSENGGEQLDYYFYSNHVQSAFVTSKIKDYFPQAIVFVSMGNLSKESLVEDSITSVRSIGHWTEKIFIITDKPKCFELFTLNSNTIIIQIAPKSSILAIKRIKAEIFDFLPQDIERVLYMDVDILVTRNLGSFLQDLSHQLYLYHHAQIHSVPSLRRENASVPSIQLDFAAFLDAKGHYVGFCAGCEKWHTGVMYLNREASKRCMKAWASVLSKGMFPTDQQSLDFVEQNRSCHNPVAIPSRHLLFAKDYLAMILTSGQTFVHLTSANRKEDSDYFYREIIVPRIRNALHPPLKPYSPSSHKEC